MPTFADRLISLRKLRNMTQAQLDSASSLPAGTVVQWESGNREPSYSNLLKVASGLRLTPGNLLPRERSEMQICSQCGGVGLVKTPRPQSILREDTNA